MLFQQFTAGVHITLSSGHITGTNDRLDTVVLQRVDRESQRLMLAVNIANDTDGCVGVQNTDCFQCAELLLRMIAKSRIGKFVR